MSRTVGATVVLAGFLLAACFGCGGGRDTSSSRSEVPATRSGDAGVSVELPPRWHAGAPADRDVIDPLTRVVASSAPVRPRDVPCQIARYAPAPTDVTVVVVEWRASGDARFEPRPVRFTKETVALQAPPAIECFDGPGGSVQFADHGRLFGAYVLAGTRAQERLVDEALDLLNTFTVERAEAAAQLRRDGISIAVPGGWDGRMLFRDAAGSSGSVFQVANFELPPSQGFEPPRELPAGVEDPIKAMDAGDVLITVLSGEVSREPAPEPITVGQLRFVPKGAPRVARGHTLAEGSFCFGTRCLRIEVDFGGRPRPELKSAVNRVLASLRIEPQVEKGGDPGRRGCPRENWPGPWTACAEAGWVRRVVEQGGYRVVGQTGSALVAEGNGRSFYVWTTSARREAGALAAEAGNWRRLAVIEGVPVFGDEALWRFWEAQRFIFWIKEAHQDAAEHACCATPGDRG